MDIEKIRSLDPEYAEYIETVKHDPKRLEYLEKIFTKEQALALADTLIKPFRSSKVLMARYEGAFSTEQAKALTMMFNLSFDEVVRMKNNVSRRMQMEQQPSENSESYNEVTK